MNHREVTLMCLVNYVGLQVLGFSSALTLRQVTYLQISASLVGFGVVLMLLEAIWRAWGGRLPYGISTSIGIGIAYGEIFHVLFLYLSGGKQHVDYLHILTAACFCVGLACFAMLKVWHLDEELPPLLEAWFASLLLPMILVAFAFSTESTARYENAVAWNAVRRAWRTIVGRTRE